MEKKKIKLGYKMILILLAVIYIYAVYAYNNPNVATETVFSTVVEDKMSVDGYLAFEESLINADSAGTPQYFCAEGERVTAKSKIASLYMGDLSEDAKKKLRMLNDRIRQLEEIKKSEQSMSDDESYMSKMFDKSALELSDMAYNKDFSKVYDLKIVLSSLTRKKAKSSPNDELQKVIAEQQGIEHSLTFQKKDYYSSEAGLFFTSIDGLENALSPSNILKMTVDQYQNLKNIKTTQDYEIASGQPFIKVVNNYIWYTVATVSADLAKDLKANDTIYLRIPELSQSSITATVSYISDEKDAKRVIVIKTDNSLENIFHLRTVHFDMIKKVYQGLKINKKSLRQYNGKTGVFIVKDQVVRFRPIEILYESANSVIIKEDNTNTGNVLLYDIVVTDGKNLEDGKIVRGI